VLERSVLDLLEPGVKASLERQVFPRLVGNGLYARESDRYWLDIGTPDRYLQGTFDILSGTVTTRVVADSGVVVGTNCVNEGRVEGPAVLGSDVRVGPGAVIERAVVLDGAVVGSDAVVRECVVCPGAVVGDGVVVEPGTIVG